MKVAIAAIGFALLSSTSSFALDPIPGSITYDDGYGYLSKSPVGSVTSQDFYSGGNHYSELYVLGADGRLKLVSRQQRDSH